MSYERLSVEDFGRELIESGDLDPVYIALRQVEWTDSQVKRWLVAYWLFYHVGAACWLSEQSGVSFWPEVLIAAKNEDECPIEGRWPRSSERRHFRGEKAVRAVQELSRLFPLARDLVDHVAQPAPSYAAIASRVGKLPQFGPWMSFKVADMLERCLDVPVAFDLGSVTMFDDPRKAALMVARTKMGLPEGAKFRDESGTVRQVVDHLITKFKHLSAPPSRDRSVDYQEVETVLCKWKSHINGHYPVGKDTAEIREGLEDWAKVSTAAAEFLHHMPAIPT